MTTISKQFIVLMTLAVLLVGMFYINVTKASHSWGNYHWKRSDNPAALKVGDNVSFVWDSYLDSAIADWNVSLVVKLAKAVGLSNPKNCKPIAGRIEVCSSKYGQNGWLGLAQIWISGSHITQAVAKMNDTYFSTSKYNTPAWRRLVMCQEVAHDFGLDHQDENFSNINLGSCMDYTSNPSGPPSNENPNAHDYEQLEIIYAHLDTALTVFSAGVRGRNHENGEIDFSDPKEWGKKLRQDSRSRASLYERNLGNGKKIVTHVIWVDSIEDR